MLSKHKYLIKWKMDTEKHWHTLPAASCNVSRKCLNFSHTCWRWRPLTDVKSHIHAGPNYWSTWPASSVGNRSVVNVTPFTFTSVLKAVAIVTPCMILCRASNRNRRQITGVGRQSEQKEARWWRRVQSSGFVSCCSGQQETNTTRTATEGGDRTRRQRRLFPAEDDAFLWPKKLNLE